MIFRIHPFAQYLTVLAGTIALYGVYAGFIAPRIEGDPPVIEQRESVSTVSPSDKGFDDGLDQWLQADSWELKPCKKIRTADGQTLYFQDYVSLDDGTLQIYPLTIVIGSNDRKGEPPLILRAVEQAILKFDRPFQIGASDPGRLLLARMPGEVQLLQPSAEENNPDGLWMETSNIQLTPTRIYTIDPVRYRHDGASVSGRNLVIDLEFSANPDSITAGFGTVSGVRRMELAFVDFLEIQPGESRDNDHTEGRTKKGLNSVRAQCSGPLVMDFRTQRATLSGQVVVRSMNDSNDVLQSDRLEIEFEKSAAAASENAAPSKQASQLRPTRIIASGTPATLVMPSQNASVAGETLEYDLLRDRIKASDTRAVILRQDEQEFVTRSIEYQIREDNAPGPTIAVGPGRLIADRDDGSGSGVKWQLDFRNELLIEADGANRVVTVDGAATIRIDANQSIRGDQIRLWLEPAAEENDGTPAAGFRPVRMEVVGQVLISMKDLKGVTRKLQANWIRLPVHTATGNRPTMGAVPGRRIPGNQRTARANEISLVSWQSHQLFRPVLEEDSPVGGKLDFRGDAVNVELTQTGETTSMSAIDIEGNVAVEQIRQNGDPTGVRERSLIMRGDLLSLIPLENELWRAHLSGTATVESPQLTMTGQDLLLDQAANRIWVDGAGSLQMSPPAARESVPVFQASVKSEPESAGKVDSLRVDWIGGMIFDGNQVWFEQDVRTSATQKNHEGETGEIRSLCQGMTLVLDRQIDFTSRSGESDFPQPQVRRLMMVDRLEAGQQAFRNARGPDAAASAVVLERSTFDRAKIQIGRQLIVVPRVDYDLPSDRITARGPGGIISWQPSKSTDKPGMFGSKIPPPNGSTGLTCLHLNFDSRLIAVPGRSEMEIDGKVRAVFGTVYGWQFQLNPDLVPPPPGATRLECDHVTIAQWQPSGADTPMLDLTATGEAIIQSAEFEARGKRLSYSQESDLLTLEGDSRDDAHLWHSPVGVSKRDHLVAGKILYRPSDQWTSIEKVRSATMSK